ncbi:hypothetical protein HZS_2456 [Henneguya salminicola]|nr:hypothetical protein HZS_2456 [Henneguya salminicola]
MTYYLKSAAWFLRGYYNFTHSGFIRSSQHFNPVNEISTKGLSFMVTGGSTGIGRNVALQLAKRPGTTVHIVCKNSQNGKEAIEFIRNDCHETSELCLHLVDLSEPTEVINFARQIVENKIKINILINNAGILNNDAQLTTQGYERSFSLNVLGTYLLTVSLAPHILKWSKAVCYPRIITVSSGGMLTEPLNTDCYTYGKNHFDGVSAYAQHKRQQLVFMDVLSDQYPDIKFSTMHPGIDLILLF